MLDQANGANLLTIPLCHSLAALRDVLGNITELSAFLTTQQSAVLAVDTGEMLSKNAPVQVLVSGLLESGAPVSIHYRGGPAHGDGLRWEINGTEGDILITGASGHTQMVPLSLKGANGDEESLRVLEIPESYRAGFPEDAVIGNVGRLYARLAADLRNGTQTAPSFDDAVATHRLIAAIEEAAVSAVRVRVGH